ncbi:MAG: hypothetical protein K0U24_05440, partial [Gammaproteobacteria bacterium]|nr:hypothetical protein [Gammaproteobacteria bacterium]
MEEAHFLLVYYCDPLGLLTIQDGVKNLQQLSEHNISLLNLYPLVKIPSHINLNDFDGIVIDSTLTYFPSTLNALDSEISLKLEHYAGVKVLLKQDEHIRTHETARII